MRRLLLLVAGVLLVASPAQAHSGSFDMKYVDGSNVVLLTFNTHQPVSGLDIEHDLRLYDLVGAPIVYDDVHVEVHTRKNTAELALPGQTLLHEATVPMLATNESKLTFAYPGSGSYTVRVTFVAGGRDISHGEFAVDVGEGAPGSSSGGFPWLHSGLSFVLGVFVTLVVLRRRGSTIVEGGSAPPLAELTGSAPQSG